MAGTTPTIKDVADLASVSIGTASRVLSGSPATSPESRERVTAAARQLDYRPNAQARALRSTHTFTVGLLVSDVRNPFFADVARAAEQTALRSRYVTLLGNANEDVDQQDRYLETFASQRVDGVLVAPQGAGSGSLRRLLDRKIPTVFVDRTVDGYDIPSVTTNNAQGIDQAITHLVARGHTRIGYIGGPQSISTGRERYEAYREAIARFAIDADLELQLFGDFKSESGRLAAEALLDSARPPTAILAADSLMALGALTALRERNVRIGIDVDIVAFDDIEWFAQLDPPLSVVSHDAEMMGRTGMELLLQVIGGGHPASVVLPTRLIVRRSSNGTRPLPEPRSLVAPPRQGAAAAIFVVGSLNVDQRLDVAVLPAPGETVMASTGAFAAGGKGGNQAVAAARAGAHVVMLGVLGDDAHGTQVLEALHGAGVDTSHVRTTDAAPTGLAIVTVDTHGENSIVVASGANAQFRVSDIDAGLSVMRAGDILLLQLETPAAIVSHAARVARRLGGRVVLNLAPVPREVDGLLDNVDVLVVNEHELRGLADLKSLDESGIERLVLELSDLLGVIVVCTAGADGAYSADDGRLGRVDAPTVDVVDTTAAGDTFVGYLAASLADRPEDLPAALIAAARASALTVTRRGSMDAIPTASELGHIPAPEFTQSKGTP